MVTKSRILRAIFFIVITSSILFCSKEKGEVVNLEKQMVEIDNIQEKRQNNAIKVAISTMISPQRTFTLYIDLINYISKKIGKNVIFVQRKSYHEVNELLESGYIDFAFICSGAYVEAKKKTNLQIIAVPVVNNQPYYYSYIIVPQETQINDLIQLRGKKFAFVDPLSNTGRLYPLYLLKREGLDINGFFGETIYTHSHDRSIELVAQKLVDGASVDSLVWDYYVKDHPEVLEKVKIIHKSRGFGIPPFVSPSSTDVKLRTAIQETLLKMHEDDEGKKILKAIGIDRFQMADDSLYDSLRKMNDFVHIHR